MQLKNPKSVRQALGLATSSLLTLSAPLHAASGGQGNWQFDSSVLYYSEADRVSILEAVVDARQDRGDDETLSYRAVIDTLTGASPNGAAPSNQVQTFTSPSGGSTYTVNPNETPLDPSFRDQRGAFSVNWNRPINHTLRGIWSANASSERDYASFGVGATLAQDMNQRNTTLSTGIAFSYDIIHPPCGTPYGITSVPTAPVVVSGSEEEEGHCAYTGEGDGNKQTAEFLLGLTQVMGPQTLMQFNYTLGQSSGYLNDPYKILSVVNDVTGELNTTSPYLYEQRPDSRNNQSLYWRTLHEFGSDVLDLSYRYFWDDWSVRSHTVDLRYRFEIGERDFIQPHLRVYQQSAADFYMPYLTEGSVATTEFASADYRLSEMTSRTVGVKYGHRMSHGGEVGFIVEQFTQRGNDHPADAIGVLQQQDLFPDLNALMLRINYRFSF